MKIAFLSLLLMASVASADDRSYRTTTQRPIKSGNTTHVYTNVHGPDGKITRYSTRIQDNGKSNIRTSTHAVEVQEEVTWSSTNSNSKTR
jgi:hypothetical protein